MPPYYKKSPGINGFTLKFNGYAIFNLNGSYQNLEMDVGYVSESGDLSFAATDLYIYLDGAISQTLHFEPEELPHHFSIPVNHALQLKIEPALPGHGIGNYSEYGFANITLD